MSGYQSSRSMRESMHPIRVPMGIHLRFLSVVEDSGTRAKIPALAAARRPRVWEDGPWVTFEAVNDGEAVDRVLVEAGLLVPAWEAPGPTGGDALRSSAPRRRS